MCITLETQLLHDSKKEVRFLKKCKKMWKNNIDCVNIVYYMMNCIAVSTGKSGLLFSPPHGGNRKC